MTIDLPVADSVSLAHSRRLMGKIRRQIDSADGSLDFSHFMDLALYAPGLGYYVAGQRKLGEEGDFVTAPELGDVFGRCLAVQCEEILTMLNGGDILEAGAGSGALIIQLLAELEKCQSLPDRYLVLEISPDLQIQQKERLERSLPHLVDRVEWRTELPIQFNGVIIANELLDALPVSRFHYKSGEVKAIHVANLNDHGFRYIEQDRSQPLPKSLISNLNQLPDDYISETHEQATAWIESLSEVLQSGVILVIDYGFPAYEFYHPERSEGTLMCHFRHRAHSDPLINVGIQDITAHVNFSELANAAERIGLEVLGYTQQAAFLLSLGLSDLLLDDEIEGSRNQVRFAQQVKKLTLPSEMGELFKVLALGKGVKNELKGFDLQNHRERL